MSAEPAPARPPRAHWIVWLFALVGVAGILAFVLLIGMIAAPSRRYQPAKVAGEKAEESFTIGTVERLTGTDLVRMEIAASDATGSYSSEGGRDLRNILLLDRRSGATRKLLPDNRRRIVATRFFPATESGAIAPDGDLIAAGADGEQAERPPAYYVLQVANAGDGDLEDVLVGRIADGGQAFVMTGIDGVDTMWMDGPTRLGMVVREKLGLYYRIVDIPSLKLVANRRIAID